MTFYYHFGLIDKIFIALFLLACVIFITRYYLVFLKLKVPVRKIFYKMPVRFFYFTLLLLALLGPALGIEKQFVEVIGKDIFVAIDLSNSMNATDVSPSRLESVRFQIKNLLEQLYSDRIGLIIFSDEAFMQCPLTFDKSALDLFLQMLKTDLLPSGGTNLAAPIQMALQKFEKEESPARDAFSKIIVLFSDGEDFETQSYSLVQDCKNKNVRIYCVGVGTIQGGRIPENGNFKTDQKGRMVISKLNYKHLQYLSENTGGKFYEINKVKNEVPQLVRDLREIKGQQLLTRYTDTSKIQYEYFALIAFLLICIDVLTIVKVIRL